MIFDWVIGKLVEENKAPEPESDENQEPESDDPEPEIDDPEPENDDPELESDDPELESDTVAKPGARKWHISVCGYIEIPN